MTDRRNHTLPPEKAQPKWLTTIYRKNNTKSTQKKNEEAVFSQENIVGHPQRASHYIEWARRQQQQIL